VTVNIRLDYWTKTGKEAIMSESHGMIIVGIILIPVAVFAFKKPEFFMRGRRSGFWLDVLGEEKTEKLIKYFSVPLVVLIALLLIIGGLLELLGY
jgi:hypothetical protein